MTTPMRGATRRARRRAAVAGCLIAVALAGCGDDDDGAATSDASSDDSVAGDEAVIDPGDGGDYHPTLDPATVADRIDNPYLPFPPGSQWVYEGTSSDGQERIEVTVLDERRPVMGIDAVVVRDTVSMDGEVIEDTYDWYTQDAEGNVWYLGEETAEYEDGQVVSTEGSWEAGVDGALPGVVMWAQPRPGQAYRQEFYRGKAEDLAEVLTVGERVTVGGSTYDDVVVIREWNPLEPDVVEEKSYAPGVGPVLEEQTAGGDDRVVLAQHAAGTTG
jgi:hypothetical protein